MNKTSQRLTREDWILAGFRALVAGGISALRVEPVARQLSSTKGSFYWHFKDPKDWRDAMLSYWETQAFQGIVEALAAFPQGYVQLRALVHLAAQGGRDPAYGGAAGEPALRDWARYDSVVAQAVRRVDAGRIDFVAACFEAEGHKDADALARLFYAAYLGQKALNSNAEADTAGLLLLLGLIAKERK